MADLRPLGTGLAGKVAHLLGQSALCTSELDVFSTVHGFRQKGLASNVGGLGNQRQTLHLGLGRPSHEDRQEPGRRDQGKPARHGGDDGKQEKSAKQVHPGSRGHPGTQVADSLEFAEQGRGHRGTRHVSHARAQEPRKQVATQPRVVGFRSRIHPPVLGHLHCGVQQQYQDKGQGNRPQTGDGVTGQHVVVYSTGRQGRNQGQKGDQNGTYGRRPQDSPLARGKSKINPARGACGRGRIRVRRCGDHRHPSWTSRSPDGNPCGKFLDPSLTGGAFPLPFTKECPYLKPRSEKTQDTIKCRRPACPYPSRRPTASPSPTS